MYIESFLDSSSFFYIKEGEEKKIHFKIKKISLNEEVYIRFIYYNTKILEMIRSKLKDFCLKSQQRNFKVFPAQLKQEVISQQLW